MTSKILLLSAALCLCAGVAAGQRGDAAADLIRRGDALYGRGQLDEAVALYDKALEPRPAHAPGYVRRGHARRAQGALDAAIADYEKATALDPASTRGNTLVAQAFINRGAIRKRNFEIEAAVSDLDRAIEVAPAELQAFFERGQARILKEDWAGAVEDFSRVIDTKGGDPARRMFAYADRGFAHLLSGRKAEAERDFEEGLKLWQKNRLWLEEHLKDLEAQLLLMRRIREQRNKGIG